MKIEHIALNVTDPLNVSKWYEKYLGLRVVKKMEESPFMTFLADDSGKIMVELYNNPKSTILDFSKLNPLMLHIAFVTEDPGADQSRLLQAGAKLISDDTLEDGTRLVMMRDPWGLAIQFCKRSNPMLE